MGIGQRGVVVFREVQGVGIEVGELVVIAAEQCQALAFQVGKIALLSIGQALRDKNLGVFQPHVDGRVGDLFPTPGGIFEDGHVDPALLEITEAPGNGSGHQDKLVVRLRRIQGLDQLRQQPGIGPGFRAHGVRRKMRGTNAHQLRSLGRHHR
ncbi:hypothetical protein D3C87_1456790 [compost metagenome]